MQPVLDNLDLYVSGFFRSLEIVLWAAAGSLLLGILLAAFRVSPVPVLQRLGAFYVAVIRNTPLTIVLFFFAFGVPAAFGVTWDFFVLGTIGLVVYTAAFVCESVRSGVNAVDAGQAEAARALGLTFRQNLSLVVLPQALRTVVPPTGSVIIAMIKNSAVVGAIGVSGDLFSAYRRMSSAFGFERLPSITGTAIGFLVMTLTAGAVLMVLERRLAVAR